MRGEKYKNLPFTMLCTFLFGLIAHGYCYFNLLYSHDSMLVYQNDMSLQISVGRFMIPAYLAFRGKYYPPALVGFLSLAFLGLATYLMVRLVGLEKKTHICLVCGVFVTSSVLTLVNATYIHDADIYMLALLLAVVSVCLCRRYKYGWIPSGLVMVLSLGLYQSYFQAAVYLFMILAVKDIIDGLPVGQVLRRGFKAIGALALGLVAYFVASRAALRIAGISDFADYGNNPIGTVGQYESLSQILDLIYWAYRGSLVRLRNPVTFHSRFMGYMVMLAGALTLLFLARILILKKIRGKSLALLIALLLLMPLGMNVVLILSKGAEHDLMVFSIYLTFLFAVYILHTCSRLETDEKASARERWGERGVCLLLSALIYSGVVFSNQTYLKKNMEYQSTMSIMTRVVDRMEQTEGYVPGETPVALVGWLDSSDLVGMHTKMGYIYSGTGNSWRTSLSFYNTYDWFFKELLAYPVNLVDEGTAAGVAEKEEVQAMPTFPAADSCRMVDGVLVVKLSPDRS